MDGAVVDLLSGTGDASAVDDVGSGGRTDAPLSGGVVVEGVRARVAGFAGGVPESACAARNALGAVVVRKTTGAGAPVGSIEDEVAWAGQALL